MHPVLQKIHQAGIPHEKNDYKPHLVRHKSLFFYSSLLILLKIVLVLGIVFVYPSEAEFSTITSNRIVQLTNEQRTEHGLESLKINSELEKAATLKLADMFDQEYFAHTSPQGVRPWYWFKEVSYNYTYAGENLAMNFLEAENAVEAWMESTSHRENILSANFEEIGIAVGVGELNGVKTTLVVQLFGKRYIKPFDNLDKAPVLGQTDSKQAETKEFLHKESNQTVITEKALEQEVALNKSSKFSWLASLVNSSGKIFFVFFVFILINLLLNIFIRFEIQHKPIIMHCLFVIFLSLLMYFWKIHFIEGLGELLIV